MVQGSSGAKAPGLRVTYCINNETALFSASPPATIVQHGFKSVSTNHLIFRILIFEFGFDGFVVEPLVWTLSIIIKLRFCKQKSWYRFNPDEVQISVVKKFKACMKSQCARRNSVQVIHSLSLKEGSIPDRIRNRSMLPSVKKRFACVGHPIRPKPLSVLMQTSPPRLQLMLGRHRKPTRHCSLSNQ